MGALMIAKTLSTRDAVEIDVEELILRLKSIKNGCDIEIIQLAISSMLDEIEDNIGVSQEV